MSFVYREKYLNRLVPRTTVPKIYIRFCENSLFARDSHAVERPSTTLGAAVLHEL